MKTKLFYLLIFFGHFFTACEKKNTVEDIPEIKTVNTLGIYSIKIEESKLLLAPKHKQIKAPLLYRDDFSDFNFNALYRIKNEKGEVGYFRFGWISYKESKNILSRINWFYKEPINSKNFEDYTIETVEVASTQEGTLKICTIGDSQTWWGAASGLRKEMSKINPDFYFTGSNTDIYAYPHEGEGGNSTKSLLKRLDKIPEADIYTLLIGTNDWKNEVQKAAENIKETMNFLTKKYPSSKIIYLSPLPTTNEERDRFNQNLEQQVLSFISNKLQILHFPLGEKMRENSDWAEAYLSNDGLHPSAEGVKFMAKKIASFIKKQTD